MPQLKFIKCVIVVTMAIQILSCANYNDQSIGGEKPKNDQTYISYEFNGTVDYKKYENMSQSEARELYEVYKEHEDTQTRYKNGWKESFNEGNYLSAKKICNERIWV